MKRNTLVKVLASGVLLAGLLTAAIPVFAAAVPFNEPYVSNLQATGNEALLLALPAPVAVESVVTNLVATGQANSLDFLQSSASEGFYGFRAAVGQSMVTEPYISNLIATGQSTDMVGN